jgi:hypothetical protein
LCKEGRQWIEHYGGQMDLFSKQEKAKLAQYEMEETERVLGSVNNILINGAQSK